MALHRTNIIPRSTRSAARAAETPNFRQAANVSAVDRFAVSASHVVIGASFRPRGP